MEENILTTTNEEENAVETTEEKTTYTKEEVEKLLQSETDRRVTSALKKAEAKNAAAIKEAEKLARMNEEEKFKYDLEKREKAIAEKEQALALAENKSVAAQVLADKGLAISLVEFVVAEDADTMKNNIDTLEKAFRASVKAEVEKRLGAGMQPKASMRTDKITKEDFDKMTYADKVNLFKTNPELYNSFK